MYTHLRYFLVILLFSTALPFSLISQVNLTATSGTGFGTYTTLKDAFDAINAGTHQGNITIGISANVVEAVPAVLNSSGAGSASYISVLVQPIADGIVISGTTVAGRGVIELNGADNVTINGDNPNTGGINRNLSIINTADSILNYTSCIRLALSTLVNSCDNVTIENCILQGSARNRNQSGVTGTSTSAATTWGIIVSGSANTSNATTAPTALSSNSTTTGATVSVLNLQIRNNQIYSAARGISINANGANVADGLVISNNLIGSNDPLNSIYNFGLSISGSSNAVVENNEIRNVQSYLGTAIRGIDVGVISSVVSNVTIRENRVHSVINNNAATWGATGISLTAGNGHSVINNFVWNIMNSQVSGTGAFNVTNGSTGIRIIAGTGHRVYHNSVHLTGAIPGSTSTLMTAAFGMSATSQTGCDVRNNIFSNQLTGGNPAGTRHVVIALPSGGGNTMNLTLNNNGYYGSTDPFARLAVLGTTFGANEYQINNFFPTSTLPSTNLRNYTSNLNLLGNNDSASFAADFVPPFVSNTDLHIPAATVTRLESKGAVLSVTNDIDNDVRPGPIGSVNGGGTQPDIGADEFDGVPVTVDVGITALVRPLTTGCHGASDTVRVRLSNFTTDQVDFAVNPVTIHSFTTGINPVNFPSLTISSGVLAGSGFLDTVVTITYNMTASGTHTFHAYADMTGDNFNANDTMNPVSIVIAGGTVTTNDTTICFGATATLTASGYTTGGTLQWQESSDNISWSNISYTTPTITITPTDTTYYRVVVCGVSNSISQLVNVISVTAPTASNVTRCGPGNVALTASGNGIISWYDVPSGGQRLDTGSVYNTFLGMTDTFYVTAGTGYTQSYSVGYVNTAGYSFVTNTAGWGLMFTVNNNCTIDSVGVYPTGTGTVEIRILDPSNNVLYTGPVTNISGNGSQKVMVPVGASLPPGNYKMGQAYTGVSNLGSQNTGSTMAYPFVSPPLTITSGSQGGGPVPNVYYWFYDWRVTETSGCESPRTMVIATVTPSDTIIATAANDSICGGTPTTLTVTSNNQNYQYTWSPPTGLNTTTGASVITTANQTITYTINALDQNTGCESYTYLPIYVTSSPVVVTFPDTAVCSMQMVQLGSSVHVLGADVYTGQGTSTNTATGYPSAYGGFYGGTRQQVLILASELQGLGLDAGVIDYLEFDVANLNSVPSLTGFTISIGTTNLSTLTSFQSGLVQVYSATYQPVTGWNRHNITPFQWDGVSNIIIETCFNNNNGGTAAGNASLAYTPTSFTSLVYFRADNNANVCTNTGTTGSSSNRPNMHLGRTLNFTYQWLPNFGLSNNTIEDPMLTAFAALDYVLTVTETNSGCSGSDTLGLIVNALPNVNLGNSNQVLCSNAPGILLSAPGAGWSHVWQDNSNASSYFAYQPGTYSVVVTDTNGCIGGDTVTITAAQTSVVNISVNLISTTAAVLDAGSGYTSYLWSTGQTTQTINTNGSGVYWVQVTDANGCTSTDTVNVIFSLNTMEYEDQVMVKCYPNPTDGLFNLSVDGNIGTDAVITIADMGGRIIYQDNLQQITSVFVKQIDLSHAAAGTYLLTLRSQQHYYIHKLVVR